MEHTKAHTKESILIKKVLSMSVHISVFTLLCNNWHSVPLFVLSKVVRSCLAILALIIPRFHDTNPYVIAHLKTTHFEWYLKNRIKHLHNFICQMFIQTDSKNFYLCYVLLRPMGFPFLFSLWKLDRIKLVTDRNKFFGRNQTVTKFRLPF